MALTQVNGGMLDSVAQQVGFRNRIINGAMMIDQRNAGASVTPGNGVYTLDRWGSFQSAASKFSVQRNAGSVTPPAGFANYLGVTSLSAYSAAAGDYFLQQQRIEGFNTADLAWGTANAATVTLSFKVYSSLTGTFGGSISNESDNRAYPFTYSIPTANTWTSVAVTIPGDTSGTWTGATNGIGLKVNIDLGSGSNYKTTAGSWTSGTYLSVTGATSVVGTNGATFYITGVQLEKGSTATSFDYRPFTTELQLCQRYYEKTYPYSVVPGTNTGQGQLWFSGASYSDSNLGCKYWFKVSKRNQSWSWTAYTSSGTSGNWNYARSGASGTGSVAMADAGTDSCLPYTGTGAAWNPATVNGHMVIDNEL